MFGSKNNQCSKNSGVWAGYETSLPIFLFNKNFLYKDFNKIYIKTNLVFNTKDVKGCGITYNWYEDGLSLNFINNNTKGLVFDKKVDGKYWLDISKPQTKIYILNKFKLYKLKYPKNKLHLDDHWSIPSIYGNYQNDLNELTKELYLLLGPFSISVLPLNYSVTNYNANWNMWIQQGYISEIILQNYVEDNFDYELYLFDTLTSSYKITRGCGIYLRSNYSKQTLNKYKQKILNKQITPIEFSLRTSLLLDLKTFIN